MYHAIVFLPLLGALIAGLFGRSIGAKASEYVTSLFLVVASSRGAPPNAAFAARACQT